MVSPLQKGKKVRGMHTPILPVIDTYKQCYYLQSGLVINLVNTVINKHRSRRNSRNKLPRKLLQFIVQLHYSNQVYT